MTKTIDTKPLGQARPTGELTLHKWFRPTRADVLRCSKCGAVYASQKGAEPCPAMREAV